jgi:chemotaxis protein MotA
MDIATILGLLGGVAVLAGAVAIEGSNPMTFMSVLACVVVIGGGATSVLVRYTLKSFAGALVLGMRASLKYRHTPTTQLIDEIAEIAETMRRQGPIALEQVEVADPFFQRGIRMIADGFSSEAIKASLERERDLDYERIHHGHVIFKAFGEAAPGMGMVGTLIGLVSMFGHMDDPKKIGPGMAIALLTTLYGAVLANVVMLPIADKLANRAEEEGTNRSLIIEALVMIREGKNPTTIKDELASYLPLHSRGKLLEEAA